MKYIRSDISGQWLKATVIGAVWAANEIVLGSFLHNLRIPLSGTIMSFLSVILVIGFIQVWNERGLIWRAGIIAALMKSLSPSAIIIGPMVGIMMEAVLLTGGIKLLGRNIAGYMLGGALAVTTVLIHKIGHLLIIYGLDLMEILLNLYEYASNQLQISKDRGLLLLIILLIIYLLLGAIAALIGYYGGRKSVELKTGKGKEMEGGLIQDTLFSKTEKNKYSVLLLILQFSALVLGMYLINTASLPLIIIYISIYLGFTIIKYRRSLNRLKNVSFWIWFAAITFLASFFLGDWKSVGGFSTSGLYAGLMMNFRAVMLIIGFAAISTELKNPVVKTVLYSHGAATLYQSVEIAFSILPSVIEIMPSGKEFIKKPLRNSIGLFRNADMILDHISERHKRKPALLILSGEIQQGKSTMLKALISELKNKDISIGGFISEVVIRNGERQAYRIVSTDNKRSATLCGISPETGDLKYGRFYFNHESFELGNSLIYETLERGDDLLVIDEIGPLEIGGEGWDNAIRKVCQKSDISMLWVVRRSLAEKAARKWSVGDVRIIDIKEENAYQLIIQSLITMLRPSDSTVE